MAKPGRGFLMVSMLTMSMVLSSVLASCAATSTPTSSFEESNRSDDAALKMQATVMDMADDYIASLGEAVYLLTRDSRPDTRGRWLAQSFLRNGVGASLDIATGPNPAVNLLDLLVLASLQTWAFETHWMPAGIGDAGAPALARLKQAQSDVWTSAGKFLSEDQRNLLSGLIDAWIEENADRTVVALVRFDEFADERRISSLSLRRKARGLLKEVREASAVVDDARLLGERLLWFAGRYPYLVGEQAELTAYRLLDQPEGTQLVEVLASVRHLSDTLSERIIALQNDLAEQQSAFFAKIAKERTAAISQLRSALKDTSRDAIDRAADSIHVQRTEAVDQFFDRFARERTLLLDDLASRQNDFLALMTELSDTISVSGALARDLTETVNAVDRVVSRFDVDPQDQEVPLRMTDVRDAAIETGHAAERVTRMLERTIALLETDAWDRRIAVMADPAQAIVDRIFWRGVILIGLLVGGLGLLKLIPQRIAGRPDVRFEE